MHRRVLLLSLFLCMAIHCGITWSQSAQSDSILEICVAQSEPAEGLREMQIGDQPAIYVSPNPVIREGDIESINVWDDVGNIVISLKLTPAAGKKLAAASEANLKKPMAIIVEGSLVSAPIIQSTLGRDVAISGDFSVDQAEQMVDALRPQTRVPAFAEADLKAFSKRMDRAFENRIFSGTVLIAVDGKIVLEKSVGYSNVKDKTPFAEDSSFRLASVSKQFTAMGIMLLKEEGKLDFDDDIRKHLSSLPYEGVTIRHLLHHNSGLPDYISLLDKHWDPKTDNDKKKTAYNKDAVRLFSELTPKRDFAPGERHEYSNTGYVLLGSIIEAASGQNMHEFFKQRVFEPLEMKNSYAFSPDENIFNPRHRVYGFSWLDKESFTEVDWNYLNGMVGDGGIYASARDLLKWDQALYGEKLVSQKTLGEAFTSGKLNNGKETGYGFGWVVENTKDRGLVVSHGGSWVGFRTAIERKVGRKLTVIVLSNNSTSQLDRILQAIEEL